MQESTKELLHGVNGGIRLRLLAERARKTTLFRTPAPGAHSLDERPPPPFPRVRNKGSSAPPTKNHRHSDYLPVILWSPLPSVILRKGTALTKNLFPRKIDVSLTLNMTNDRCLDSLHLFYYSLHDIACKQSLRMLRSSVRLRLLRMRKQRIVNNE